MQSYKFGISDVDESSDSSGNEVENSAVWRRVKPEPISFANRTGKTFIHIWVPNIHICNICASAKNISPATKKKHIDKPHVGQIEVRAGMVARWNL